MSLNVDSEYRRGHSRSRSRDDRKRDDRGPADSTSYVYPGDDSSYQRSRSRSDVGPSAPNGSGLPYPTEGGLSEMVPGTHYGYDPSTMPSYTAAPTSGPIYSGSSRDQATNQPPGAFPSDGHQLDPHIQTVEPPSSKSDKSKSDRRSQYGSAADADRFSSFLPQKYGKPKDKESKPEASDSKKSKDDKFSFLPQKYSSNADEDEKRRLQGHAPSPSGSSHKFDPSKYLDHPGQSVKSYISDQRDRHKMKKEQLEEDLAYGKLPPQEAAAAGLGSSYVPGPSSQVGDRPQSSLHPGHDDPRWYRPTSPAASQADSRRSHRDSFHGEDPRSSQPNVYTAEPPRSSRDRSRSRERKREKSRDRGFLTVDGHRRDKSRDRSSDRSRDKSRDRSRDPSRHRSKHRSRSRSRSKERTSHRKSSRHDKSPAPSSRMSNLTLGTGAATLGVAGLAMSGGASPLLEAYRGTYQQSSPMPSPLLLPTGHPSDVEPLSPIASDDDAERRRNRRARFHCAEDSAERLAKALRGEGTPDKEPLVEILPSMTHEQVMELRVQYKQLVKTGSHRKGVNIAKHIRARLKDENPNLMKACYAVALGMWESEAYWANFWYHGDKTRRELLIESLMGRTNDEIRYIKDAFTDKKYDDSLTKCMREELREDKFKKAVMMVLDERRMDEYDSHGRRVPVDMQLVDDDVEALRKAIKAEKGGESLMISVVVTRSDSHLREILNEYDHRYRANFARDALKKSGNLVGELLAHILNGVINRPVRDALLLHHALTASRKDELRHELLTSRLVRLHWDASHMAAVRHAYRSRYNRSLQDAVKEATSGHWGHFCQELCIARVPNDVRRFEKVAVSTR
ncbi:unnamed protein product [Clonostachys rosea]|uniref:Annexin n=1 Tax=Bionectria ochroleuca TaxID=29856 RepID=A0ABY6UP67_BIOOC|nr:unnamed protein product [Clonostachys rosea]